MAGLPDVIGLLYRADWTRLSLSAEVRSETDRELLPPLPSEEPPRWYRPRPAQTEEEKWSGWHRTWPAQKQNDGRYSWRGTLLIGAGGRWRLDGSVPGPGARGEAAEGYDGERGWSWRPAAMDGPPPLPVKVDGAYPPVPELFCSSRLLGGYTLEELGPVTVAGRDAIAVAATPRRDVLGAEAGHQSRDRIEVAVDAELGIVLRRVETSGGAVVTRTELTDLTMNPPAAADPARFTAPLGSLRGEGRKETPPHPLGEPGGKAATTIAGLTASGLGTLIRHAPHRPGHGADEEYSETAMPLPDPAPLGPGDDPPPGDLLHLLYRAGDPHDLRATVQWWHDAAVMADWASERARATGQAAIGQFMDAVRPEKTVSRIDARLRVSGPDRYRLEYSHRGGRARPTMVACDGERRWQVYPDRTVTSPAAPLGSPLMFLVDPCWLLRAQLSGGQEITYRGRRARQVRVTRVTRGGELAMLGPLMFFPADAIVDAETGCLLRLLSYSGDRLAFCWELDDISTEPGDSDEFQVRIPPGTRTVEETGDPVTDILASLPGVTGTAARAAAETVTRTTGAVSAARTLLDNLRSNRRPPS